MEYILYQLRDIVSHGEHLKKNVRTSVCEQNLKQKRVMQQDNDTNTQVVLPKNSFKNEVPFLESQSLDLNEWTVNVRKPTNILEPKLVWIK